MSHSAQARTTLQRPALSRVAAQRWLSLIAAAVTVGGVKTFSSTYGVRSELPCR